MVVLIIQAMSHKGCATVGLVRAKWVAMLFGRRMSMGRVNNCSKLNVFFFHCSICYIMLYIVHKRDLRNEWYNVCNLLYHDIPYYWFYYWKTNEKENNWNYVFNIFKQMENKLLNTIYSQYKENNSWWISSFK